MEEDLLTRADNFFDMDSETAREKALWALREGCIDLFNDVLKASRKKAFLKRSMAIALIYRRRIWQVLILWV